MLTIEVRKAGAAGEARYSDALSKFAQLFAEGSDERQAAGDVPELVAAIVASAIAREVGEGRAGQLEGLLPELLFTALAPCLGGEQAAAEMRRVAEAQGVAPGRGGPIRPPRAHIRAYSGETTKVVKVRALCGSAATRPARDEHRRVLTSEPLVTRWHAREAQACWS